MRIVKKYLFVICLLFLFSGSLWFVFAQANEVAPTSDSAIAAVQASTGYSSEVTETSLGNLVADAVCSTCGCDAAVICGGHILHSIVYGEITWEKIQGAVNSESIPVVLEITPSGLWSLLESAVSRVTLGEDETIDAAASECFYYPQISGFEMKYDTTAPVGERVVSLQYKGASLDQTDTQTIITLAVSSDYLLWEDTSADIAGLPTNPSEQTEAQMLLDYVTEKGHVIAPKTDRVKVLGTAESLFSAFGFYRILPYLVLVILLIVLPRQRHRLRNMDGSLSKRYKDYNLH